MESHLRMTRKEHEAMAHMFFLEEQKIRLLQRLVLEKIDGSYIVLQRGSDFSDIAQWSDKYQNIKFVCVRTDRLDESQRIG